MKIIPMPLGWANVWSLCTFDLDPNEGVRRFGPFHQEETASEVVAGPEEYWAFGISCGLEVLLTRHRAVQKGRLWELEGNLPEPQHALEHLGLNAVTVTWQADRVRRFESKTQTDPGRFEVWRLDDNGNEALVDELASEATANCVVRTYEARLHKQTYFVREVAPHKVDLMRTGLAPEFSRANFEAESDLQGLCARLARVLTDRVRAATDLNMEIEWIVADLRNVGHDVQHWDGVIANWDGRKEDPYLWVTLRGVDTVDPGSNTPDDVAAADVTVSFRPRLPPQGHFKCPLCWSDMEERDIWLSVQGHGSFVAPGVKVHFECPGVPDLDATVGTASAERRRPVRVCGKCGAGLLLPLPR